MKTFSQISFDFDEPVTAESALKKEETQIKHAKQEKNINLSKTTSKSKRGRKSIKKSELEAEHIKIPEDEMLFQKQYYSIGEVAEMFRVNTSLIRLWEKEFDIIEPRKNRKGDRHFRPVDIKNLKLIHYLIRQQKFTIEGAKDYIRKNKHASERFAMIQSLQKIRSFLLEIKASL